MFQVITPKQKGLNSYAADSIVFSFWKKSLDFISAMLEEENIPYYRIDGSLRMTKRREILANFQLSRGVSVLLMTLGTGAVGYVSWAEY